MALSLESLCHDSPQLAPARFNFWGYSTVNYFSPMARFSASVAGGAPVRSTCDEFKLLVRECHKRGIEVRKRGRVGAP